MNKEIKRKERRAPFFLSRESFDLRVERRMAGGGGGACRDVLHPPMPNGVYRVFVLFTDTVLKVVAIGRCIFSTGGRPSCAQRAAETRHLTELPSVISQSISLDSTAGR